MNWQQTLNPILNLWKKLNQKAGLIEFKLTNRKLDKIQEDPVLEFIRKDFEYGLRVVQFVHQTLAAINKIIRSLMVAGKFHKTKQHNKPQQFTLTNITYKKLKKSHAESSKCVIYTSKHKFL